MKKIIFPFLSGLFIFSCSGIPDGITPVKNFNVERYMGKWYEIARLDHSFERGLARVSAEYSLQKDGSIRVINRGYNPEKNKWSIAEGRAIAVKSPDIGMLKVSFFGPFYGGYNIIILDDVNYSYSVVCGSGKSYLWILAREPSIDENLKKELVGRAREMGFETGKLIFPAH